MRASRAKAIFSGAGDVHDAVYDERRVFESAAGAGHGPTPTGSELGDVGGVDFGEGAKAIATDVAVVAGPFAFVGVSDAGEVDAFAEIECGEGEGFVGGVAGEAGEVGEEILDLVGRGVEFGHHGGGFGFAGDVGDLIFREQVEVTVEAHELEIEIGFALEDAADCFAVGEGDGDGGVGGAEVGAVELFVAAVPATAAGLRLRE